MPSEQRLDFPSHGSRQHSRYDDDNAILADTFNCRRELRYSGAEERIIEIASLGWKPSNAFETRLVRSLDRNEDDFRMPDDLFNGNNFDVASLQESVGSLFPESHLFRSDD